MNIKLTIDRFENNEAVLIFNDGAAIAWPKNNLPDNLHEGSVLNFTIQNNSETEKEKKELAKEILNQVLDVK